MADGCEEKGCQDKTFRPADMYRSHEERGVREENKSAKVRDLYGVHVECCVLSWDEIFLLPSCLGCEGLTAGMSMVGSCRDSAQLLTT